MNTAINPNLVHESESQRQFARVKLPASFIVNSDNNTYSFQVTDISAGGLSFMATKPLPGTHNLKGKVEFNINGMNFLLPVEVEAKSPDRNGRVSCAFTNMSPQQTSALRHLISAHLNGDLVTSGDMLNVLTRENFTKSRSPKMDASLQGFARFRAVVIAFLFLMIGIAAASFIGYQVYQDIFMVKSQAAVVDANNYQVQMPRDGVINLIAAPGEKVKPGQVIGRFEAPIISYLNKNIDPSLMQTDTLSSLSREYYSGPIVSPCDCEIGEIHIVEGQYVAQGEPVLSLNSDHSAPFVFANFDSGDSNYLNLGKTVTVTINGQSYTGVLSDVFIRPDREMLLPDSVSARISISDQDIRPLVGQPASVKLPKFELQ